MSIVSWAQNDGTIALPVRRSPLQGPGIAQVLFKALAYFLFFMSMMIFKCNGEKS